MEVPCLSQAEVRVSSGCGDAAFGVCHTHQAAGSAWRDILDN